MDALKMNFTPNIMLIKLINTLGQSSYVWYFDKVSPLKVNNFIKPVHKGVPDPGIKTQLYRT